MFPGSASSMLRMLHCYTGGSNSAVKPRINSSNPYLPDGCMTYDQRYYSYSNERFFLNR